jgi:hypothetical protein
MPLLHISLIGILVFSVIRKVALFTPNPDKGGIRDEVRTGNVVCGTCHMAWCIAYLKDVGR